MGSSSIQVSQMYMHDSNPDAVGVNLSEYQTCQPVGVPDLSTYRSTRPVNLLE